MWQYPATALDRLADMISERAMEDTPTTNLFAWVRWIVTKEENLSQDCHADWKIGSLPVYYNALLRLSPHMALSQQSVPSQCSTETSDERSLMKHTGLSDLR